MKPSSLARAAATVAALFMFGCATPVGRFADPNLPIEVIKGQSFKIVLEANPTTGYAWALTKRLENHIVTLAKNEYHPNDASLVGSGGVEVWTFVARHEGVATITLAYRRPWEKEAPPSSTRVYQVTIHKK